MINPETLDLRQLPSIAIESKRDLPSSSGIYFAIDSFGVIQYIGQSRNINQRWGNHHREVDLQNVDGVKIAYLLIDDSSLLKDIEQALIEWFTPFLNGKTSQYLSEQGFYKSKPRIEARVKQVRESRNISQNKLARILGMSLTNLQRMESNRVKSIPLDMLDKLCDIFNCEVADLLVRVSESDVA